MDSMKKWGASAIPVILGIVSFITPSIQAYVAAHPQGSLTVLLLAVVAAHNMTAPKDQPKAQ